MANTCAIDVKFFPPPADLAPCFTIIYSLSIECAHGQTVSDRLLPEFANLRYFCGPPATGYTDHSASGQRFQVTGPSSGPIAFEIGSTRVFGIGLRPLGWARFVDGPASEYANSALDGEDADAFADLVPLCDIFCHDGLSIEAQFAAAMEALRRVSGDPPDAQRILAIEEALADPYLIQVEDFATRVGMSKRTLERVCNRHFGFSPRVLLRRQRVIRVLTAFMLERGNWSSVIDLHYHDHAHFVREFRAFMGVSPTEYAEMDHPILSAFMAERRRVWGSPAKPAPRGG